MLPYLHKPGQLAADLSSHRLASSIPQTHRVLGQIAGEQSQLDHAVEHLTQSRAILEELGSEHELALTLVEEARLLEDDVQRKTLERTHAIFVRLGATAEIEGVGKLLDAYTCA